MWRIVKIAAMILAVAIIHAFLTISVYSFCLWSGIRGPEYFYNIDVILLTILTLPLCYPVLAMTEDISTVLLISLGLNSLLWGTVIVLGFKFLKKKLSKNWPLIISLLLSDAMFIYFIAHSRLLKEYELEILTAILSLLIAIFQIILCLIGYFRSAPKSKMKYFFAVHALVSIFLLAGSN
jgi:hypothetical protein